MPPTVPDPKTRNMAPSSRSRAAPAFITGSGRALAGATVLQSGSFGALRVVLNQPQGTVLCMATAVMCLAEAGYRIAAARGSRDLSSP